MTVFCVIAPVYKTSKIIQILSIHISFSFHKVNTFRLSSRWMCSSDLPIHHHKRGLGDFRIYLKKPNIFMTLKFTSKLFLVSSPFTLLFP